MTGLLEASQTIDRMVYFQNKLHPTSRAFFWLKMPTSAFTFKSLSRHTCNVDKRRGELQPLHKIFSFDCYSGVDTMLNRCLCRCEIGNKVLSANVVTSSTWELKSSVLPWFLLNFTCFLGTCGNGLSRGLLRILSELLRIFSLTALLDIICARTHKSCWNSGIQCQTFGI